RLDVPRRQRTHRRRLARPHHAALGRADRRLPTVRTSVGCEEPNAISDRADVSLICVDDEETHCDAVELHRLWKPGYRGGGLIVDLRLILAREDEVARLSVDRIEAHMRPAAERLRIRR